MLLVEFLLIFFRVASDATFSLHHRFFPPGAAPSERHHIPMSLERVFGSLKRNQISAKHLNINMKYFMQEKSLASRLLHEWPPRRIIFHPAFSHFIC